MIRRRSVLKVADNSGARSVVCIGIPGRSNRLTASLGDAIKAVIRGASATGLVKDHQTANAVVVRTHKEVRRADGSYIRFDDNAAVLLGSGQEPLASRVFGPVARELKERGYGKIVSLAEEVW